MLEMYVNCHPKFHEYLALPYGVERRKKLMSIFEERGLGCQLAINRRYCVVLYKDPDLTRLVKAGKLLVMREGKRTSRRSYLTLAPKR